MTTVAGVPVAVTYCPLCNAALTFRRTLNGRVLDFSITGRARHSDLIMYDRQTESWWQHSHLMANRQKDVVRSGPCQLRMLAATYT
jgi:hypothetical protein